MSQFDSAMSDTHDMAMRELQAAREEARGATPEFPSEWGPPISQQWLVVTPSGKERYHDTEPSGKSLTVWRWVTHEATATFNIPCTGGWPDPVTEWRAVAPPGRGWRPVGETAHRSTLWVRLNAKVIRFQKQEARDV